MRIMVTGGSGFIGSHFIDYLARNVPDVIITNVDGALLGSCQRNNEEAEERLGNRYRYFKANIAHPEVECVFALTKPEIVINFAAESHVDRFTSRIEPFVRSNVVGAQRLMSLCITYGTKRMVQVSTDEVYGSLPLDDVSCSRDEMAPLQPNSPNSATKASAELLAQAFWQTYGLDIVTTRSSNNYGPRQYPEEFVPVCIRKALAKEPIPIHGDSQNRRGWIHVEDNCRGIWAAATNGRAGEAYNLGADKTLSNVDLARKILTLVGANNDAIYFVSDRLGHDRMYAVNSDKARRMLKWAPAKHFEEALAQTVAWYMDNPGWWG